MSFLAKIATMIAVLAAPATGATAATFQTAYSFTGTDGSGGSGLTLGQDGMIYGFGPLNNDTVNVFQFDPDTSGLKTVGSITQTATPMGAPALNARGTIFGVSQNGGQTCGESPSGCGFVFSVNPSNGRETRLYSFTGGADGGYPSAGLIIDSHGILYGTASYGGTSSVCSYGCGTIFKFNPATRAFSTLYSFPGTMGYSPNSVLTMDKKGLLYGTTSGSLNKCDCGTVFKLNPSTGALTTLFAFTEKKDGTYPAGAYPSGGLAVAGSGLLYGTTSYPDGTVFQLNPSTKKITTLYTFTIPADGEWPNGVTLNAAGNTIYGVSGRGGIANPNVCLYGCGTVYELTPPAPGQTSWTLTTLHDFTFGADGAGPAGPLIFDAAGALEATTFLGGSEVGNPNCCGTIFKETP